MATLKIERLDGTLVNARYMRHVRTLAGNGMGTGADDVDLYRLADGTEIECISPESDGRATPRECDRTADHYDGHPAGK